VPAVGEPADDRRADRRVVLDDEYLRLGTDIFGPGQQPLSQSEVDSRLAESASPTSVGGTVRARCVPGGVEVVGATPAQGFGVETDDDGVDDHPKITFTAGEREIEIRLRCSGGTVTHAVEEKD